ncbi:MAG TPA: hypothetical protein VK936_06040 [Longimicrobiales bacterium]|nr:hypothetical protein [Longimicrobiales bacterium]
MKEAAEAVLRELPSVIGACVREDVNGHPREVHLLVRAGPNPRHLAYDVRDLLEERLGVPVDQRVISIAQLAEGRRPGPAVASAAGLAPAAGPDADSAPGGTAPDHVPASAVPVNDTVHEPRALFAGITTEAMDNHVRVCVTLELDGDTRVGEAVGLDTGPARLRAVAGATLKAVDATCVGRSRFEVEHIATVHAFGREYVLVSVLASSPYLGRRPIPLVGAQPVEMDAESATALAALKAVNRTLSLVLRLPESPGARGRPPHRRS